MSESMEQMRERHEKEIRELQDNCKHEELSDWMNFMWAPGHFDGKVKICNFCEKVIEHDFDENTYTTEVGQL